MVELDVVHDRDIGQVLQELRRLVEEGAVVLVPLDHELTAAADAVTALEILGNSSDEHARVRTAVREQPPGKRRGGGLPVCSGDDDGARGPEEMIADRLGQRTVPDFPVEHFLELGVATGDRIPDDHQVELRRDVLRLESLEQRDPLLQQEVAHRRVDVLIRSTHVIALALEQRGQRAHGGTADANQVDALHEGFTRMLMGFG